MSKLCFLVCFCLLGYTLIGQNAPSVSAGAWINLGLPTGAKVGVEYPIIIHVVEKEKELKKKDKIRKKINTHELLGNFSVAYTPLMTQYRFLFNFEVGYRITRKHGWFFDTWIGTAYENITNIGETYTVDDQGNVEELGITSRGYAMPNFGIGYGYDFRQKLDFPLVLYMRFLGGLRLGHSRAVVINVFGDTGVTYKF